jgi:hypothetical protein
MTVQGPNAAEDRARNSPRVRIKGLVAKWSDLRAEIARLNQVIAAEETSGTDPELAQRLRRELRELQGQRENLVDDIQTLVIRNPQLAQAAINSGFRQDLLPNSGNEEDSGAEVVGTGNSNEPRAGGGTGRSNEPRTGTSEQSPVTPGPVRRNNNGNQDPQPQRGPEHKLMGVQGKDFQVIERNGHLFAVYAKKIGGNVVEIALHIPKGKEGKYGVSRKDARTVSEQRWKRINVIGDADEAIIRGEDRDPLKGIGRSLQRRYGGTPVMEDDDVLAVFIAADVLGLTNEEIAGELRKTGWFKNSTEYERVYVRDLSPEERQERIKNRQVDVIDLLEDNYGLDWMKRLKDAGVKNPMQQVREWARKVASGELGGDPTEGLRRLGNLFEDRARDIEGTPAWVAAQQAQEAVNAQLNKPEDIFERIRTESMQWLGQDRNDTPRLDRALLMDWANDLSAGVKSDGDWAQFLRNQMQSLYPYFDPNLSFQEQASPYKSIAERIMGDTLDWSDRLFQDFTKTKANGEPTNRPMSLYEFELKVRDDDRAWKQGTQVFDEVVQIGDILMNKMLGVS